MLNNLTTFETFSEHQPGIFLQVVIIIMSKALRTEQRIVVQGSREFCNFALRGCGCRLWVLFTKQDLRIRRHIEMLISNFSLRYFMKRRNLLLFTGSIIRQGDLVCCGVLSGNRNFEGRIHPNTRANYLASPLFVIGQPHSYALQQRNSLAKFFFLNLLFQ